jgi:hypothetical protein
MGVAKPICGVNVRAMRLQCNTCVCKAPSVKGVAVAVAGEMLLNGDGQLPVDWGAMGEDGEHEGGDGEDGSIKSMSRSGSRNSLSAMSTARSPAPSVGRGGGRGGGGSAHASMEALNEHVVSLEEENVSLRALTRSLMNERHELLSSLDTSANEVNHLRRVCNALQSKLQSAGLPLNKSSPRLQVCAPFEACPRRRACPVWYSCVCDRRALALL